MLVELADGCCVECGGQMEISDADDCSLDAECTECGSGVHVEIDFFNDGGVIYWPAMMAELEDA